MDLISTSTKCVLTDICERANVPSEIKNRISYCVENTEDEVQQAMDMSAAYLETYRLLHCQTNIPLIQFHFKDYWTPFMTAGFEYEVQKHSMYDYQMAMFTKNMMLFKFFPLNKLVELIGNSHPGSMLDIGGGLGFYSALFEWLFTCGSTIVEKPEIKAVLSKLARDSKYTHYSFNIDGSTRPTGDKRLYFYDKPFPTLSLPKFMLNTYSLVYMSEVLHGRNRHEQIEWIRLVFEKYMHDDGILIINEVADNPDSAYCRTFDLRMQIKTACKGSIVTIKDIQNICLDLNLCVEFIPWCNDMYYLAIIRRS